MKLTRFIPLLLLAAVSCSDESTIPEPARYSQLIDQIRIAEDGASDRVCKFLYYDQQHVRQIMDITSTDNKITTSVYTFTYDADRFYVEKQDEGVLTQYAVQLNAAGYAETVYTNGEVSAALTYNSLGYYYEQPSAKPWHKIEYLLSDNVCNLSRAAAYGDGDEKGEHPVAQYAFEYGSLTNKSNLDLTYFALLQLGLKSGESLPLSLLGYTGRQSHNMPVQLTEQSALYQDATTRYTYETDSQGYITRITGKTSRGSETISVKYEISYIK